MRFWPVLKQARTVLSPSFNREALSSPAYGILCVELQSYCRSVDRRMHNAGVSTRDAMPCYYPPLVPAVLRLERDAWSMVR